MKPGQLFGASIIAVCVIAAGVSLRGSVRKSLTVREIMAAPGEPCSIYGKPVKTETRYDMKAPRLDFVLKDNEGRTIPVVYHKPKPETFDQADMIKVYGAYREGVFQADELTLKCPSKYIKDPTAPSRPGDKTAPYAALGKGA
jgi:cytochrome c-type biogenesis protein CcmE